MFLLNTKMINIFRFFKIKVRIKLVNRRNKVFAYYDQSFNIIPVSQI